LELLPEPLLLIWDSHHTWRYGGETPAETWGLLGRWVRHVHLKDSLDKLSERHPFTYVLPGDGQMPMAEVMSCLRESGFDGFVSLEWERLWHLYLPPLRDALTQLQKQPWFETPAHEPSVIAAAH
jgi:sugar phosphate isomerase/epimerase